MDPLLLFVICVCHNAVSVSYSLVVTCWIRTELLALLFCMWGFLVFCHFPIWCPRSGVVLDCIDS